MAETHFKENIKYIRVAYSFTQREMADYLSSPIKCYQSYEEGRSEPKSNQILDFCCILNLTFEIIMGTNMALGLSHVDILRLSIKSRKQK